MKTVSLSGSLRENVGKKDATDLRRQGKVPCVLYGGQEQIHFFIDERDAKKLIITPNVYIVKLNIGGKEVKAIVQEAQLHPVTDRFTHLDFIEVIDGKPVKVKLPIKLEGFSIGVRNGGKLRQNFRKLTVKGLEADLPENITVNIEKLRIGGKIRVSDININGVELLDASTAVVVAVQMARGAANVEEEEETEEATEAAATEETAEA